MIKKSEELVELRPAYVWTCPECGNDTYGTLIIAEHLQDEVPTGLVVVDKDGLEVGDVGGDWLEYPVEVNCKKCKLSFDVEYPEDMEDEDDSAEIWRP